MPENSISSTYRGYRKQALYTLWRLLTDANSAGRAYRPEGDEDLAVFDGAGQLLEVVQVKDYSSPLTLSDFKPESPEGFFPRLARRRREHPNCQILVASFGPIGPELKKAVGSSGPERDAVARKLNGKNKKLSVLDSQILLEALNGRVVHPDEVQIRKDIAKVLSPTIAGVHGDTAIELLLYWVFDASEQQRAITRSSLLQQVERIGAYLSALRDHSTEWNVAVGPLREETLSSSDRQILLASYRQGVQATWRHILADADCPRPQRLAEVHEALSRRPALVIRGASGQGKSSLALRYLRDYYAEGLRFHVRVVDGRTHAIRIANALRNHIVALGLRAVVLVDLSPSDTGWIELVRDLTSAGIKVLVTVREEDFHRSGTMSADLMLSELSLDSISREEAEAIYESLRRDTTSATNLDFNEAWAHFTAVDIGPLLEFTHIVAEGETLSKKVAGQVARLQNEAASSHTTGLTERHLRLLALAAIANASECRVNLQSLCAAVQLDPLTRPLAVLENEYFVRVTTTESQTVVAPLHGLRSQAIVAALLHDSPEIWRELAIACLPLIVDADLERFLLTAFSRRPQDSDALEMAIHGLAPRTWTHAGGMARALIWEGVNRYERENHAAIAAAVAEHGDGWWLTCDPNLASDSRATDIVRKTIADITKRDESELPVTVLTDKSRAFDPLRAWAKRIAPPSVVPRTNSDWLALADIAFWLGEKKIDCPLRNRIRQSLPETFPRQLSIGELAQFVSGLYALGDAAFLEWHRRYSSEITAQFVRETDSICVLAADGAVTVLFAVAIATDASSDDPDAHDFHAQAIKRVTLLRHLFPNTDTVGSEGVGMEVLSALVPRDETIKNIPTADLPDTRTVQLNATFTNLVRYRLQRSSSWGEYTNAIVSFRRAACETFRGLQRAWTRFLEHQKISAADVRRMPGLELTALQSSVVPMFPKSAVDEWGCVSETRGGVSRAEAAAQLQLWGNIQRFADWRKLWQDYEHSVGQVAHRILETMVLHLARKNFPDGGKSESKPGGLLVMNLALGWQALGLMQSEFRRWFSRYLPPEALAELELHENSVYTHLWPAAFAFVYSEEALGNAARVVEAELRDQRRFFLRGVLRETQAALGSGGPVEVLEGRHRIAEKTCLVVVCDHENLREADAKRPEVLRAFWRATRFRQWRAFEWTPLTVEWSHILVVHAVRGRALSATGSFISTTTLFGSDTELKVSTHHLLPMPVDLNSLGIRTWDSPLISAAIAYQGHFGLFMLTMLRFGSIAQAAIQHALDESALDSALAAYSRELSRLRRNVISAFEDLIGLLHLWRCGLREPDGRLDRWLARLEEINKPLLLLGETGNVTLTLNMFMDWLTQVTQNATEVQTLLNEILDCSLSDVA